MTWREGSFIGWGLIGVALLACAALARASKGRLPGVGALARVVTTGTVGRWLVIAAWAWLGWHAFAR